MVDYGDLQCILYMPPAYFLSKEDLMSKDVKVGVVAGRCGPIGKYQWSVLIIDRAYDDVMKILNAEQ